MSLTLNRRMFALRFASVLSALGITASVLPTRGIAQSSSTPDASGIRKLNGEELKVIGERIFDPKEVYGKK